MRYFGVVYDVGLDFEGAETFGIEPFDPALVKHDMSAIADDLHANAVRIEGEDVGRLVLASRAAHEAGLAVFFSPWKIDATVEETIEYLGAAATAAEELRDSGADIVFIVGCECTIFTDGLVPGSNLYERSAWVKSHLDGRWPLTPTDLPEPLVEMNAGLNAALRRMVDTVRGAFHGPLTYSAACFEAVDYSIFDLAGPNYYREQEDDQQYVEGLDYFRQYGKPLVIPEFGCCTYKGAAALGARGWRVLGGVNDDGTGKWTDGTPPPRAEQEQADYLEKQLGVFAEQDIYAAFWFSFSVPWLTHGEGARDLDRSTYSMVATYPADDPRSQQMPPWRPKEAYVRAAQLFAQLRPAPTPPTA